MKKTHPVIIAMKGHPGTGKTTLAKAISTTLRCPLLDRRETPRYLFPPRHLYPPSTNSPTTPCGAWPPRRFALASVIRVAVGTRHKVVAVECRATDQAEWRQRLEGRDGGWHKPAAWRDMESLLEGYDRCYEYDAGEVAKLVFVDIIGTGVLDGALSAVLGFIEAH